MQHLPAVRLELDVAEVRVIDHGSEVGQQQTERKLEGEEKDRPHPWPPQLTEGLLGRQVRTLTLFPSRSLRWVPPSSDFKALSSTEQQKRVVFQILCATEALASRGGTMAAALAELHVCQAMCHEHCNAALQGN